MKVTKVFLVTSAVLMVALLLVSPVLSQVTIERAISFSGYIASVSRDLKYIIMREAKLFVSGAGVVDERGFVLNLRDLKPGLFVSVEGIENSKGAFAKKITIRKPPKPVN